jgi:transcription antitermination factor NusG
MENSVDVSGSQWHALYTRPRFEKKVDALLQEKGFESYLPLHTVIKPWSDRLKKVREPLFSCYVFVRVTSRERGCAIQTHGVVRMVAFDGSPAVIPAKEIEAVRQVLENGHACEPVAYLPIGQRVEVVRGPLTGLQGRLVEQRGQQKLLIGIKQIRQAISVEVHASDVRPIESPNPSRPRTAAIIT